MTKKETQNPKGRKGAVIKAVILAAFIVAAVGLVRYVLAGAILGATVTFFIGRYLGRDFAASVSGIN